MDNLNLDKDDGHSKEYDTVMLGGVEYRLHQAKNMKMGKLSQLEQVVESFANSDGKPTVSQTIETVKALWAVFLYSPVEKDVAWDDLSVSQLTSLVDFLGEKIRRS